MLTNIKNILIGFTAVLMACNLTASTAFKINGKTTTVKGLYKEHLEQGIPLIDLARDFIN